MGPDDIVKDLEKKIALARKEIEQLNIKLNNAARDNKELNFKVDSIEVYIYVNYISMRALSGN